MSPESKVSPFVPATIAPQRPEAGGESHAAGFAAGWAAGARAAAESAQEERARERAESARRQSARDAALCDALLALGAAVQAWRDRAVPVLAEAEQSVHAAALELAAAVLTHELADGPTAARSVLTRALAMPAELEPSTMRVHPETLVEIERLLEAGEATLPGGVELAADPRLGRGDVLVEHSDGALDARIGAGLDRARAILEGGL